MSTCLADLNSTESFQDNRGCKCGCPGMSVFNQEEQSAEANESDADAVSSEDPDF